jgi:hypothetical protein
MVAPAPNVPKEVCDRYRDVLINGRRITRMEESTIGTFHLSSQTAWALGTNNLGLFVGATDPLGQVIDQLKKLESSGASPRWIVIAATKVAAAVIAQRWITPSERRVAVTTLGLPRTRNNITLATPESLKRVSAEAASYVAGLLLVDMLCYVHRARNMPRRGRFVVRNDRPQMIADFRNALCISGWVPPLILLTRERAKSVYTSNIARAYCLDGFWFVDGQTFAVEILG